ncbi:type II toxin-antitoxin system VapC family toxin [Streptomyces sp. NPDC047999]|uniref:type II toxin-antitoxin system VapC family toxin n=1 Tax=Streptomyces sp. NPDC047999 TaxID=3365497 RepID=UPI00371B099D
MIYLDSCALVKLILEEEETDALVKFLDDYPQSEHVTSELAITEVMRTLRRSRCDPHGQARIDETTFTRLVKSAEVRLGATGMLAVDQDVLRRAGALEEFNIKSLDAIHLASALVLMPSLDSFVTYDAQLGKLAEGRGLRVAAPS